LDIEQIAHINWRITELTDSLIKGDPTLTDYQKCIKANALTGKLDDIWFGGIQENVKAFSPQENYDRVLIVSDQACSGRDQLTDLRLDKENFDGAGTISAKPTGERRKRWPTGAASWKRCAGCSSAPAPRLDRWASRALSIRGGWDG